MMRNPSVLFVVLAAIGAFYIGYGVASGIGFDLWTSGRLVFRSGPPRLEPTLAVGALAAAFVGVSLVIAFVPVSVSIAAAVVALAIGPRLLTSPVAPELVEHEQSGPTGWGLWLIRRDRLRPVVEV